MNSRSFAIVLVLAVLAPIFSSARAQAPMRYGYEPAAVATENFSLTPHMLVSATLMVVGGVAALVSPFLMLGETVGTSAHCGLSLGTDCRTQADPSGWIIMGAGLGTLFLGAAWLAIASSAHRRTTDAWLTGGVGPNGGWLGAAGSF